ncbi:MAG: hypothetical protein R3F65_18220 [bacterium]
MVERANGVRARTSTGPGVLAGVTPTSVVSSMTCTFEERLAEVDLDAGHEAGAGDGDDRAAGDRRRGRG